MEGTRTTRQLNFDGTIYFDLIPQRSQKGESRGVCPAQNQFTLPPSSVKQTTAYFYALQAFHAPHLSSKGKQITPITVRGVPQTIAASTFLNTVPFLQRFVASLSGTTFTLFS